MLIRPRGLQQPRPTTPEGYSEGMLVVSKRHGVGRVRYAAESRLFVVSEEPKDELGIEAHIPCRCRGLARWDARKDVPLSELFCWEPINLPLGTLPNVINRTAPPRLIRTARDAEGLATEWIVGGRM